VEADLQHLPAGLDVASDREHVPPDLRLDAAEKLLEDSSFFG
jgi:hypothetical protein